VVTRTYVPDAGDVIWLTFDPQAGREQRGRRPAVVLSPRIYNDRAQLALVCPVTSRKKGYPFEVPLPDDAPVAGVVLADQVKSVGWRERRAERAGSLAPPLLEEIRARIRPLFNL
jgi:mRNA interferase MazF